MEEKAYEVIKDFKKIVPMAQFTFQYKNNPYHTLVITAERMVGFVIKEITLTEDHIPQLKEIEARLLCQGKFCRFLMDIGFEIEYQPCSKYWYKSTVQEDKQYFIDSEAKIWERVGSKVKEIKYG